MTIQLFIQYAISLLMLSVVFWWLGFIKKQLLALSRRLSEAHERRFTPVFSVKP